MSPYAAKEAIRFLGREIAGMIDRSEKGRRAYEQANMVGPSHISAIIVSQAEVPGKDSMVDFKAFVELHDADDNQYEAEIRGRCERLPADGGGWRALSLEVLDAGPLPKSG